jgi:hypothetical protein
VEDFRLVQAFTKSSATHGVPNKFETKTGRLEGQEKFPLLENKPSRSPELERMLGDFAK